jgi:sorting nexin-8
MTRSNSNSLFADDDFGNDGAASPWDLPTPRKQQSRADVMRNLLPTSDVPDTYVEVFDAIVREDGAAGKVGAGGVARTLAAAKLGADEQSRIMSIVAPSGGEVALGRGEFNCLLALIGLAQEGEAVSLDTVDERRKSEFTFSIVAYLPYRPPRMERLPMD